ncbi:hypothetical protein [Martelella mediterranea]|uniref:hypothetical protein n=1 Tax=Martelella mediterranea TaxID=293089 RepID=UPI0012BA9FAF|nr:hypothetical protein [Martelella mediterranea]
MAGPKRNRAGQPRPMGFDYAAIHAAVELWLDRDEGSLSDMVRQVMTQFRVEDIATD